MRCMFMIGMLLLSGHAASARPLEAAEQGSCLPAIASAELAERLPGKLLGTIALVESGRPDPITGRPIPWPWTINVAGVGHVYASKAEAIAAVLSLQLLGIRSIDVGCLQINLYFHPSAFASLDAAFDPATNAAYGARFLADLHRQTGGWPQAAAAYHSQTPQLGRDYETRVMAIWPLAARYPDARLAAAPGPAPANQLAALTPEFAAQVRQMQEDRARLQSRFGALVDAAGQQPVRPKRRSPRTVARAQIAMLGAPIETPGGPAGGRF